MFHSSRSFKSQRQTQGAAEGKWMSEHILQETGILVPVGSGTINYEKKLRVRILTQAWEGRREILIGNRCSHLFSLLYINVPFQSKALWLVFNLQVCAATVELLLQQLEEWRSLPKLRLLLGWVQKIRYVHVCNLSWLSSFSDIVRALGHFTCFNCFRAHQRPTENENPRVFAR